MWEWVLSHGWLWRQVLVVRAELDERLNLPTMHSDAVCDVPTYLAILVWAARFIRQNPAIAEGFAKYVNTQNVNADGLANLDSLAVEWLLLGLVELPPAGVDGVEPIKGTHG